MSVELVLIGGGKMGAAMLSGWLKTNLSAENVLVVEPFAETRAQLEKSMGVRCVADAADIPDTVHPKTIVLAVKPQMMDSALPAYARFAKADCLFLSIAAGKTISYFENILGADAVIVRAMPNTPAAVGRGITVGYPNGQVSEDQRQWADTLLAAVGEVSLGR